MRKPTVLLAFLIAGAMVLTACGGGGSGASSGASSGGAVTGGASGIKDPALIGKWISADGGNGYEFKDDFTVIATVVGAATNTAYNIVEGGKGSGKVEIAESSGKVTWDYKIADNKIELTTPDGRSRRMTKQ